MVASLGGTLMIVNLSGGAGMNAETEEKIDAIYNVLKNGNDMQFIGYHYNTDTSKKTGSFITSHDEEVIVLVGARTAGGDSISQTCTCDDSNIEITELLNVLHPANSALRFSCWRIKGTKGATINFSSTGNYDSWVVLRFTGEVIA